jgi:dienelactone hydrolase
MIHRERTRVAASIILVVLLIASVFAALTLDSNFNSIEVTNVSVMDNDTRLSGLLYKPNSADEQNPAPALVVAHGISGSKEMVSSIGLELARNGFVSLCMDLYGHGESQGSLGDGRADPTFGLYSALQYLKSLPFVDSSSLGLVGHSLGAGAARATVTRETDIEVTILVGGGLGENSDAVELNSTFPKNLLVVVGKYDVLFDMKKLTSEVLPPIFGIQQEVVPEILYGDFAGNTARKLVTPSTTHLLETVDPKAISEIVAWAETAIVKGQNSQSELIYGEREIAILFALIALVGIVLLSYYLVERIVRVTKRNDSQIDSQSSPHKWRIYLLWAVINLILLLPMFGVGYVIQFPPLVFGASIAWWMMSSGLVGLLLVKFSRKTTGRKMALWQTLKDQIGKNDLFGSIISFAIVLAVVTILGIRFDFTFRIVSTILRDFSSVQRVLTFFAFIPFFFAYFLSEGLFLHYIPRKNPRSSRAATEIRNYGETIIGKIMPFVLLLVFHYSAKILFGVWILSGFIGFLMEFLVLIVPIFVVTTTISWWFYRKTGKIGYGALLNTLLMSLVASVIFPF